MDEHQHSRPAKIRYRGRAPLVMWRRWFMCAGWLLTTAWQVSMNVGLGIYIGLVLLFPAVLLRSWRSWPYLSLHTSGAPCIEIRDFLTVHREHVESSSTLRLNTKRKSSERHYTFRIETAASSISSRAYVGGEAGLSEVLALADQWEAAGGHVVLDGWLTKCRMAA